MILIHDVQSPTQQKPESWNMGLGGLVLESLILYLKGMRIMMFQLSGFYYIAKPLNSKPYPWPQEGSISDTLRLYG